MAKKKITPEPLALPEIMDLAAAGSLAGEIRSRRGAELVLDGGSVQRVGGLCLQVLLAARDAWRSDSCAFRIAPVSERLRDGVFQLGAAHLLEEAG